MGIYLNPKNENFRRTVSGDIYVDKTMLIREMNRFIDTGNNYICISRPRRFGKTIASEMLSAYYSKGSDSRELFAPYKIAKDPGFEEKLNKYNVIKIDVNNELQNTNDKEDLIGSITRRIKKELKREFENVEIPDEFSLAETLLEIYSATDETFIIIMDEYDVLVREQVSRELFDKYLSFLNGLFKSSTMRPAISLAYITGILPVVRDRIQSKLNNFKEYTILDAINLAEFIGFNADEVKVLCDEHNIDFNECKRWYDGYRQRGYEIYNPESIVEAITRGRFGNYWNVTSTYRVIVDRIRGNFGGSRDDIVRMISGEEVDVIVTTFMNTITDFATKDDLFTYLIHLGYLAYDMDNGTCRIPNEEIRQEWINAISIDDDYKVTNGIIKASKELLAETIKGNSEAVARALNVSHIHVTSNRSYNNEDALQSAIYLAYIYALNKYMIVREMTAGRGFADVTFIPYVKDYPAMIVELKRNASPESAIEQIRKKQYYDSLSGYKGNLLFVGINYDEKEKTHECRIERFEV